MVEMHKALGQTDAGTLLKRGLDVRADEYAAKLRRIEEQLEDVLKNRNAVAEEELREAREEANEQINKLRTASRKLMEDHRREVSWWKVSVFMLFVVLVVGVVVIAGLLRTVDEQEKSIAAGLKAAADTRRELAEQVKEGYREKKSAESSDWFMGVAATAAIGYAIRSFIGC